MVAKLAALLEGERSHPIRVHRLLLRLAERIDSREVRRVVRDWPEALCVEVRCCAHCGHTIAAKRDVQAP